MINLKINPDLLAQQMIEALDNASVYLVAYRYEPAAVKAINILKLAAGVRAVCQMLIDSMKNEVSVNPHHIERFSDIQVQANNIIDEFNGAVQVTPFVRQNGASAGKESVVLGEVVPAQRKVTHTGKNGPNGTKPFIPFKNLSKEKRANARRSLTDDQVREIRKHFVGRANDWDEFRTVGKMYGVGQQTIYSVVARKTYDWIT